MQHRKGRVAQWFPITLAVTGSFALLVGIFVAVLSIPRVVATGHPISNTSAQGALYIGTNTCFTCHSDRQLDWSLTLYTQKVVDAPQKPKAVINLKTTERVQQIDANEMVDAYTSADEATLWQNPSHQFYVIKTEDGHILLPRQQNADRTESEDRFIQCIICHTENFRLKPQIIETMGVAAIIEMPLI